MTIYDGGIEYGVIQKNGKWAQDYGGNSREIAGEGATC
jgi:hypothetical protein